MMADSGADQLGNVKALAADALERYGPLDVLFGGYRGFRLYPVQYIFSSVSSYLTFVPERSWETRQKIMCDADDLLDVAELWQARRVVPYSDGGAPWYWMRGLGPRLDGSQAAASTNDPDPIHVREVASRRSGSEAQGHVASPVQVSVMRPGETLWLEFESNQVRHHQKSGWPYPNP